MNGATEEEDVNMQSKSRLTTIALAVGMAVLAAGCAAQYQRQEQQALQQPINCATAEGDIRVLQSEKAHAAQQFAMGISAITPAGLVLGTLTGTEQTKAQVASGDYNRILDQKIAQIKATCGLQ